MNAKILLSILPVVALCLLWPDAPQSAPSAAADRASETAARPSDGDPRPSAGADHVDAPRTSDARRSYQLSYRHDLRIGAKAPSTIALDAAWSVLPVDGRTWAVEVASTRVSPGGPQLPAAADLHTTLFLRTDAHGVLDAIAFQDDTGELARTFLEALAVGAQLTPPPQGAAAWASVETDATGRARAEHQRRGDQIMRTKSGYLELLAPNVRLDAVSLDGHATATLDDQGRVRALSTEDRVRARLGTPLPDVTSVVRVELTPIAPRPLDREHLARQAERARFQPLGRAARTPVSQHDLDRAATAGAGWSELADDLRATLDQPPSEARTSAVGKLLSKLGAAIRLDPGAAAQAAATALAPEATTAEIDAMAGALAAADTVESTRALEAMLSPGAPADARRHAAASLALSHSVDEGTASALVDAASDADPRVRSTATLALGAVAGRLPPSGESDPVALLLGRYAEAEGDERLLLLEALANSGDPRILPALTAALGAEDPELAATAAYGLRFVEAPEADAELARLLTHPLPALRTAAVKAIRLRDLAAWQERLAARLGVEPDEQLRALIASLVPREGARR